MRKIILTVVSLMVSLLAAMAEGYQVNTLSARQCGMGHTGVAQKLGSESMFFNPAGMAYKPKVVDISANFNAVFPAGTCEIGNQQYKTINGASTPLMLTAGFRIYDNLACGIAFYTPYGSGIDWGKNWPGAVLNQSVKLAAYTVQPTISWRLWRGLSVGAGLQLTVGTVNLNKGLVSADSYNLMAAKLGLQQVGENTPVSLNLQGTSRVGIGYNIGIMYEFNPKWIIGVSYRSKTVMTMDGGTASLDYAPVAEPVLTPLLGMIDKANFKAKMPCVGVLTFGGSFKPNPRLTLALDAQLSFWSAYKSLKIEFLDSQLPPNLRMQDIAKKYRNSWALRVGAQYAVTNRFDIRAGFVFDTTPVNIDYYNPETPGMTKLSPTLGFTFRPLPIFAVNVAVQGLWGLGTDNAQCVYDDIVRQQLSLDPQVTFKANYRTQAWIPSIGFCFTL